MRVRLLLAVNCLLMASCASTLNMKTSENYARRAYAAEHAGNWVEAREDYRRSIINAQLADMQKDTLAVLWYEYGRASGVVCEWHEATAALSKAYEFDKASGGPYYMSSYELARMNYQRKDYPTALKYYRRAYVEFESDQVDTKDPIGYAIFLDEFVRTLKEVGLGTETKELAERAERIRKAFPGKSSHTEKTPYGSQCKRP